MRILIRPRLPVLALLLFAPAIPELLTGSTPVSNLFFDPVQFLLSFGLDIGLYGTGALLIREFAVSYHKGWASILLLGAAYGIAEEGFAVHTFFQTVGSPVNQLGVYGHAFGVNWLWALGLTAFHATYSIALPILLTQLWFPAVQGERWLDRGSLTLVAAVYLAEVSVFALLVGHGPTPTVVAFFLAVCAMLLYAAYRVPGDFLSPRPGPSRIGRWGIALAGTLGFDAWLVVLVFAGVDRLPAALAAAILVAINLGAIYLVVRRIGTVDLEWSKFYFATGMLAILFVWDIPVEFAIPGLLGVAAAFAVLQLRLRRVVRARLTSVLVPLGASGAPTA